MRSLIFVSFILVTCIFSCDIINPPEAIPAFLEVNPFVLEIDGGGQGTATHDLRDAWLILDNTSLGVFELPLNIPILNLGEGELTIYPGIRENGINTNPVINPFMESFVIQVNFVAGETVTVNPTTSYESDVNFRSLDEFEGATEFSLEEDGNDLSKVAITNSEIFEGEGSGHVILNDSVPFIETGLNIVFSDLPSNGEQVYAEIHFKGDIDFNVGVKSFEGLTITDKNYFLGIRAAEEWKKIYISFSSVLLQGNYDSHQILFRAGHDPANGPESNLYLDNFKLMHY